MTFFFKQWVGVRKAQTGRDLDKRNDDECPETRQNPPPDLILRVNAMERLEEDLP
jgi:hypothetical protein